jgi:hypothetical protein
MNILKEADQIVNQRSEEKERMYGPFSDSMELASSIATLLTGKNMETKDMYMCMVSLKLSREAHSHKEDNLLDAVAYLGALNNYYNEHQDGI